MPADLAAGFDASSLFVAVLIATAGLWWFDRMLPSIRTMALLTRIGMFLLIWLAYFVLILIIVQQTGG